MVVTLAIIGILATIASASYTQSVLKAHRADGQASLLSIMQAEERYFTENNTYDITLSDLGYPAGAVYSTQGYYVVTAAVGSTNSIASSVVLTASPVGADPSCATLTIDNTYTQNATGTNPSVCWQQN
jgi:type IV pilus assembly protein PilE